MKIYSKVIQKIGDKDGRISPEEIGSETSVVNLFFTKPIPIIEKISLSEEQKQDIKNILEGKPSEKQIRRYKERVPPDLIYRALKDTRIEQFFPEFFIGITRKI